MMIGVSNFHSSKDVRKGLDVKPEVIRSKFVLTVFAVFLMSCGGGMVDSLTASHPTYSDISRQSIKANHGRLIIYYPEPGHSPVDPSLIIQTGLLGGAILGGVSNVNLLVAEYHANISDRLFGYIDLLPGSYPIYMTGSAGTFRPMVSIRANSVHFLRYSGNAKENGRVELVGSGPAKKDLGTMNHWMKDIGPIDAPRCRGKACKPPKWLSDAAQS